MNQFEFMEKLLDGVAVGSIGWRNKWQSIINLRNKTQPRGSPTGHSRAEPALECFCRGRESSASAEYNRQQFALHWIPAKSTRE